MLLGTLESTCDWLPERIRPELVIIDEAGQASEPYCAFALVRICLNIGHLVLLGDHKQLPPSSNISEGNTAGLSVSLL